VLDPVEPLINEMAPALDKSSDSPLAVPMVNAAGNTAPLPKVRLLILRVGSMTTGVVVPLPLVFVKNVAVSWFVNVPNAPGAVPATQFVSVAQSAVPGAAFQVVDAACADREAKSAAMEPARMREARRREADVPGGVGFMAAGYLAGAASAIVRTANSRDSPELLRYR
jgi:hypothetical protein